MKRLFYSVQGKTIAVFLLFMTLFLVTSWFIIRYISQDIMTKEKEQKLLSTAVFLDIDLGDRGYNDILKAHGAQDAAREEKIAVLNRELSDVCDRLASAYTGLGVGYYSRELDAILTYGPSAEYQKTVGTAISQDHPGRVVMATNQDAVIVGTMVRGRIMNAMHPIERDGAVIGYIWANELSTDIEQQFRSTTNRILIIMGVFYVLSVALTILLSRRTMRDVNRIVRGVRELRFDLTKTLDKADGDLGEVVDSINAMAVDIARANEERKALLMAEAVNVAQRDFLARMSHEIRTPMNGVLGMTRLAKNATTEEQRLDYLEKIHLSASLLLGIINDILDFSKIEAGKMEIEKSPFSIAQIIDNIQDLIRPKMDEKNLQLVISVDESVPATAVGDGLRLSQVVLNLLGNAAKFTLEGSVTLEMKSQPLPSGALRLDCLVRDTGIGMNAQRQDELFKPFIQADNSTARKFGGTGLGLSISKALVELMGGSITVKSEPNKGSEFVFFIELEPCAGEAEEKPEVYDAAANRRYDGVPLLVVEDNEINREIAGFLFEEMGFSVDFAENGEEGVDAFLKKTYALIFMDIRMPVMDGLDATREIRRIERETAAVPARRVPIIAMTANAMREDQEASKEAGMDGHVSKPIDVDELRAVLYQFLA
jgi:signal transduction histidine kinase/CheY-like chemotaxis protein